jgi:hypothetical protein
MAEIKADEENMLAKMETNQERREAKMDTDLKEVKEGMKS